MVPDIVPPSNLFDRLRCEDDTGEYWTGRALMPVMGYTKWENFEEVIIRARAACRNSGFDPDQHASWHQETVPIRQNAGHQSRTNYRLTRYGAYLVAMNGDPRKEEIAMAQTYFAARTHQAELMGIPQQRDVETVGDELAALELATQRTMQAIAIAKDERAKRQLAEHNLGIAQPKAEAWTKLASADGDYSVADAAKILSRDPEIHLGERRLFTFMSELRWIFRAGDGRWRIYQAALEAKRLCELPSSHYHPRTGELVLDPPRVRVTVKGIEDLRNIIISRLPQRPLALDVPTQLGAYRRTSNTGSELVAMYRPNTQ